MRPFTQRRSFCDGWLPSSLYTCIKSEQKRAFHTRKTALDYTVVLMHDRCDNTHVSSRPTGSYQGDANDNKGLVMSICNLNNRAFATSIKLPVATRRGTKRSRAASLEIVWIFQLLYVLAVDACPTLMSLNKHLFDVGSEMLQGEHTEEKEKIWGPSHAPLESERLECIVSSESNVLPQTRRQ